jgi:hypothetical protein
MFFQTMAAIFTLIISIPKLRVLSNELREELNRPVV